MKTPGTELKVPGWGGQVTELQGREWQGLHLCPQTFWKKVQSHICQKKNHIDSMHREEVLSEEGRWKPCLFWVFRPQGEVAFIQDYNETQSHIKLSVEERGLFVLEKT